MGIVSLLFSYISTLQKRREWMAFGVWMEERSSKTKKMRCLTYVKPVDLFMPARNAETDEEVSRRFCEEKE